MSMSDALVMETIMDESDTGWQPYGADGAPAAIGMFGRWLDSADDVVATDTLALRASRLSLEFPREWPE